MMSSVVKGVKPLTAHSRAQQAAPELGRPGLPVNPMKNSPSFTFFVKPIVLTKGLDRGNVVVD